MTPTDRIAALAARLHGLDGFPWLESARLRLRAPIEADLTPIRELFSHPDVLRYWSRPAMRSDGEALAYVAHVMDGFQKREHFSWIVADLEHDHMLGTCTLYDLQPRHLRAGLGYALHPSHHGHGYASEAAALACAWGFEHLGLHRIEADIHPDNQTSRAVLLRCGFRSEGRLRQRFVSENEIQDSEIFGRLADETSG